MNYEWIGNTISKKNPNQKSKKLPKPHVNKKPLARKRIFAQTPISHYTLKTTFR